MVSNDPIKDYMQRHACGFPEALDALAAQLGPPTAHDIRRALQTLGRAGAPVDLLEALEAWSDGQMPPSGVIDRIGSGGPPAVVGLSCYNSCYKS